MSNRSLLKLLLGVTVLSATLLMSMSAKADRPIKQILQPTDKVYSSVISELSHNIGQVTNVNQLRDISTTDWAYEALQSLVERYDCIAGFPNHTYRGSGSLSRYEFAAGLNSCINQIEPLIGSSEEVVQEDLHILQKLRQEFDAELATIDSRVDNLQGKTAFLEDNQFSTTTKLKGRIVNYLLGTFGNEKPNGEDIDGQITFSSRHFFCRRR